MAGAGRPGSSPLTAQRERFARLIAQGVSASEACRLVGVNRKTGHRWRHGRPVASIGPAPGRSYPPVLTSPSARPLPSRLLSEADRVVIADRRRAGWTCEQIAVELGRATSTVSREMRRHRDEFGRYGAAAAQRAAAAGRARPRARRVESDDVLRAYVVQKLTAQWSPEQISNRLRAQFPETPQRWLCAESIYQAMYDPLGTLASFVLVGCVPAADDGARTAAATPVSSAGCQLR
jgi:hypothetical protein